VIAHGDLVWQKYRVVLEYDGRHHAEDPTQFAIDIRRLDDLAEARYRVIRVDKALLADSNLVLAKLRRALHEGGWRP
jgi:very-short-patch-repair endonuclease